MEMLRRECHSPAIVVRTGYGARFDGELLPDTAIVRRNVQCAGSDPRFAPSSCPDAPGSNRTHRP